MSYLRFRIVTPEDDERRLVSLIKQLPEKELNQAYRNGLMRKMLGRVDAFCLHCYKWVKLGEWKECTRCGEQDFFNNKTKLQK